MKVLIATANNVKVEAALEAFNLYFDDVNIEAINISSDVSDMPYCSELERGVKNRLNKLVMHAASNNIDTDYFVAIESGIYNYFGSWMITSLIAIKDRYNKISYSTSGSYPIPNQYAVDIIQKGLQVTLEKVFENEANGHSTGGVGYLTKGKIIRKDLMKNGIILAITRFIHNNW